VFQRTDLLNSLKLWQSLGSVTLGKQAVNSSHVRFLVEIDLTDLTVCEEHTSGVEELRKEDVKLDKGEVLRMLWLKQVVAIDK
jgi:hypothetical protein